jgi:hypothetical protein
MRWDLLVIFLTIWNCLSIPFFVAFPIDENIIMNVFDKLIDFMFFLDIVFNFFTTYINLKTN